MDKEQIKINSMVWIRIYSIGDPKQLVYLGPGRIVGPPTIRDKGMIMYSCKLPQNITYTGPGNITDVYSTEIEYVVDEEQ